MPTPLPCRHAATLTLAAFALAIAAAAEDRPTPSVRALRLADSEQIRIDGHLDDAVWRAAPAATELRQREPVWLTPTLNLQGFAARSITSGPGGEDWAYRIGLESSGDRVGFSVDHLLVGPEMNAEMGFILREDIRRTAGCGHLRLRPRCAGLRRVDLMAGDTYVARVDGRHQDHEGRPAVFMEWNSGDRLVAWHFRGANQLDEAFDLSDRVPVPVGRYDLDYTGFALASSEKRALSIAVESNFMNALGRRRRHGRRRSQGRAGLASLARPGPDPHPCAPARRGLRLRRRLAALLLRLLEAPRGPSLRAIQQPREEALVNGRVHLIHAPGSDLYLVWSEERGSESEGSVRPLVNRTLAVKLSRLIRF